MSTPQYDSQSEPHREIPRFAECPPLNAEQIDKITRTVFPDPNPQPADVLFVFGSSRDDCWDQVAELFRKKLAPIVYIGGGVSGKAIKAGRILSHMIRDNLVACGIPMEAMIVDERSTNTLQDAIFGKEIFDQRGVPYSRILFACKWPHGGRCLRTLQKVFPGSELFPFMYDFKYEGIGITEDIRRTWSRSELARSFVWGEYERIRVYSGRGDICP